MKLSDSLKDLQELVNVIEDHDGEIPEELVPEISDKVTEFKASIDKRISLIEYLDYYSKFIGERAKELQRKEKSLKNALQSIKEHTKWQVEQNPHLDWKGTTKKLKVQKGPAGKNWRIKTSDLKDIIPVECLEYVPKKYYYEHVVYILDKAAVTRDLKEKSDELFNVCRLKESTNHLRIQ